MNLRVTIGASHRCGHGETTKSTPGDAPGQALGKRDTLLVAATGEMQPSRLEWRLFPDVRQWLHRGKSNGKNGCGSDPFRSNRQVFQILGRRPLSQVPGNGRAAHEFDPDGRAVSPHHVFQWHAKPGAFSRAARWVRFRGDNAHRQVFNTLACAICCVGHFECPAA